MKVEISQQVRSFAASLAPDPRKKLRQAIQSLSQNKGDIKALEEELSGFHRLRVGEFRVIYRHVSQRGSHVIKCEFVERREVVYELFAQPEAHSQARK